MDHPSLQVLLDDPSGHADHLSRCPRCRVELRIARESLSAVAAPLPALQSVGRTLTSLVAPPPPRAASLPPGTRVGPYEVVARFAEGGSAVLYLAETDQGERVALKHLVDPHPEVLARLGRELEVQRGLDHPNLVPAIELIEHEGSAFLALHYVSGPTLARWLAVRAPPLVECRVLFDGVVAGLGFAHAAGVVHRDLKPANVLVDVAIDRLVPRVADFGLAKVQGPDDLRTRTGAVFGTPAFMAPEQIRDSGRVDARADVFSLGCVLYALVAGRLPFPHRDVVSLHEAMVTRDYPRPAGVPSELIDAIDQMLAPDPADRPVDARAVRALLGAPPPFSWDGDLLALAHALAPAPRDERRALRGPSRERPGLVAREAVERSVHDLLEGGVRAVTLWGPAGVGKSALLDVVAGRLTRGSWPGGAWYVDLAGCRTSSELNQTVAAGLSLSPGGLVRVALGDQGPILLALDHADGLDASAVAQLEAWRRATPGLVLLVTSRRPLDLEDDRVMPIEPLDPEAALALLLARGREVRPSFAAAEAEQAAALALVQRLDGLPLALELAAGRASRLEPSGLLARLDRRFAVLRGEGGRQVALEAAIETSWEALDPSERQGLAACSVFAGGFDLDAAEAVLPLGDLLADDLLGLLERRSLVVADRAGPPRFHLLESLRVFAAARVVDPEGIRRAHAAHYGREAWPRVQRSWAAHGPEDDAWVDREAANLGVVAAGADPVMAARTAAVLLRRTGQLEVLGWARAALRDDLPDPEFAALAARLCLYDPDWSEATAALARVAIERARRTGLPHLVAYAEASRAAHWTRAPRERSDEAERVVEQVVAACLGTSGVPLPAARALMARAVVAFQHGRLADCERDLEAARGYGEPAGPVAWDATLNLAVVRRHAGDDAAAVGLIEDVLARAVAQGSAKWRAVAELQLGGTLILLDTERSLGCLRRALAGMRALGEARQVAQALIALASATSDPYEVERYLREARAMATELGDGSLVAMADSDLAFVLHATGRLDEAREAFEGGVNAHGPRENQRSLAGLALLQLELGPEPDRVAAWAARLTGEGLGPAEAEGLRAVADLALRLVRGEAVSVGAAHAELAGRLSPRLAWWVAQVLPRIVR